MPKPNKNVIRGSKKDDDLNGSDANEFIFGRGGNDTINSGGGTDVVSGGSGADTFVITADTDNLTIKDFESGVDVLDVTGLGIDGTPFDNQYVAGMEMLDGNTILTYYDRSNNYEAAATITLEGVATTDLELGDFVFA